MRDHIILTKNDCTSQCGISYYIPRDKITSIQKGRTLYYHPIILGLIAALIIHEIINIKIVTLLAGLLTGTIFYVMSFGKLIIYTKQGSYSNDCAEQGDEINDIFEWFVNKPVLNQLVIE